MRPLDWSFPYASRRAPVLARNVVATSQPLAAQAGLAMLGRGGNAVDAALAAAIALTVVEPTNNGVGSDAFAILWDGHGLHALNASGRSAAGHTADRFADATVMPAAGWDSVTVPGAVSGWVELSARFGKLPFADLFAPAIRYARDGYPVSPQVARQWALTATFHAHHQGFARTFLPGSRAPYVGEVFRCEDLARTLEAIADTRGESFYRGDTARRIAACAREEGGALSEHDLAQHRPEWVKPLAQEFSGCELHELPPNTQGVAALAALGVLEAAGPTDAAPDSAESLHLQIEAMKLALADAYAHVADPAAMEISAESLLDRDYLAARARLIDRRRAGTFEPGRPPHDDTVYLCAADSDGVMVSYIQSNFVGFGSGIVVPETGVSLQNRGAGFTLDAHHPNRVGPRKRPFHTLIPAFVTTKGAPLMAFGVMGGPMQAQGHVQMMVRVVLHRENPQAAADAPRWQVMQGRTVAVEKGFAPAVLEELAARGHEISELDPIWFGGAQLAYRLGDGYVAASDPRKDGQAVGF